MTKSSSPYDRRRRPEDGGEQFKRAWEIVSNNPQISRVELAAAMGLSSSYSGQYWMKRLAEEGIIELPPARSHKGVRVLVPFGKKRRPKK